MKSKLRKLEGLTYEDLKKNIKTAIKLIPIEYYSRILKGSYIREKEYYKKASRKHNYKNYKDWIGVLNVKRCKKNHSI